MVRSSTIALAIVVAAVVGLERCLAFTAPSPLVRRNIVHSSSSFHSLSAMKMSRNCRSDDVGDNQRSDAGKQLAASAVAAAYVLSSLFISDPAMAFASTPDDAFNNVDFAGGSTQVIAARSGGRMGGRSSYSAPRMRSSMGGRVGGGGSSYYYRGGTTIIAPPRPLIAPPPVVVTPGFGYSPFGFGYGYNPLGGFGLGYGLGAMQGAGSSVREYNQEREIARGRAELEAAKQREAELEQRIKALEASSQGNPSATDETKAELEATKEKGKQLVKQIKAMESSSKQPVESK